jgi:hypothetical protein
MNHKQTLMPVAFAIGRAGAQMLAASAPEALK